MGGVKTDIHGLTPIPGLYAAGEVACVSVHGGNRLGANSLLDTLVFGRRSGEHAAKAVHGMSVPEPSRAALADEQRAIDAIIRRDGGGRRVSELKAELGATMDKQVAVGRGRPALRPRDRPAPPGGGEDVAIDDKGSVFNQDVLGALELQFMLDNAEAIVISAIERKESRGAQYRTTTPSATTTSGSSTSPPRTGTTPTSPTQRSR